MKSTVCLESKLLNPPLGSPAGGKLYLLVICDEAVVFRTCRVFPAKTAAAAEFHFQVLDLLVDSVFAH